MACRWGTWRCIPHIPAHLGCGAGQMGKKLFIVLSDCWWGGLAPPIWVCICVRETVGVWCLGLSLLTPTGLGSLSLAFVALRLRQSIGPLRPSGYGYRALVCRHVLHTLGVCRGWPWTPGLGTGRSAPGPSGVARVFLFAQDRFIFSGSEFHVPVGSPCVAIILRGEWGRSQESLQ